MKAKILHLDIETAPNIAAIWQYWEQTPVWLVQEWYMLTWAAKWDKSDEVYYSSINRYKDYKKDPEMDGELVSELMPLINEADIIVGQNVDKFDIRKINAKCIIHGILPPRPYRTVDILKATRSRFAFNRYSLDEVAQLLGVGSKVKHSGKELWQGCVRGDKASFDKMIEYNIGDVELSEAVYHKILPWIKNHPGLGVYTDNDRPACRTCGSEKLISDGYSYLNSGKYQAWKCKECGGWQRDKTNLLHTTHRKNLLMSI